MTPAEESPISELPGFFTSLTFWNDVGIVTLVLLTTVLFVWLLLTERLVLGRQYRKVEQRCEKLEAANLTLAQQLSGQNASDRITNTLLDAIRGELESPPADEVK